MFKVKFLYHFTKSTSIESILVNNTLRLSKLIVMNDPKEFMVFHLNFNV